ncbi:MAG: prepilin peptidase [Vulcanimicrobiaceae bacterium]
MSLAILLVLAACAVAVVTDVRARRIPNLLTGALALAALGFAGFQGAIAFFTCAGLMVGVLLVGFVAFSLGWLGGGDVKLLAAAGGALGTHDVVAFLLYTAIGGGILAVAVTLATGRTRAVASSVAGLVRPFAVAGTAPQAPVRPTMLPYAVAIAFGAVAVALSHSAAPFLRLPL